ncbi:MAG TPA: hypothetical protein VEY67_03250 [Candidatus Dormibacteraeota bacterium]|nr:hypothetical protein [Candidatus Dormibacteraeota bacterium]
MWSFTQGPPRATVATLDACTRCGRDDRLVRDDGPTICRICLLAWGSYAAVVSSGRTAREPAVTELLHWTHRVPILACPLCRAGR